MAKKLILGIQKILHLTVSTVPIDVKQRKAFNMSILALSAVKVPVKIVFRVDGSHSGLEGDLLKQSIGFHFLCVRCNIRNDQLPYFHSRQIIYK